MKFRHGAVSAAVALCCTLSTTTAFQSLSSQRHRHGHRGATATTSTSLEPLTAFGLVCLAQNHQLRLQSRTARKLAEKDDDEDDDDDDDDDADEPLGKGVDSVSWLPTVIGAKTVEASSSGGENSEVIPLFPLGGIVYIPNSEHVLNIFEPRYREMYSDILMNGTKRFVVSMSHPTQNGRFAQMGVLFELEDLKEVSEQFNDNVKYICNHKVTGRVKIHRILNPEAWQSRETYLRVEGTIYDDSGRNDNSSNNLDNTEKKDESIANDVYGAVAAAMGSAYTKAEKEVKDSFADLVDIQHELQEDVRFTKASVMSMALKPGPGKDGLWQTIRLWQSFSEQKLMARQNELQKDFQEKLQEFLKNDKGLKESELPSAIGFQDLPEELQRDVQELRKRMNVELEPYVLESTLTMQKLLEAEDHDARCKLLKQFIDTERKRLSTKKSLAGMFAGQNTAGLGSIPAEERLSSSSPSTGKSETTKSEQDSSSTASSSKSILTDEPDAWG